EIEGNEYEYVVTVTAEVPDEITSIDADPEEFTLHPGSFESFDLVATKLSGAVDELIEDDQLRFDVSEPEKVEVKVGEEGLEVHATDAAEVDDEITVTVVYHVNGKDLTTTLTVKITE